MPELVAPKKKPRIAGLLAYGLERSLSAASN